MASVPSTAAATSKNGANYTYQPLPSKSSFRYLELLPGKTDEGLAFKLHFADWDNPPGYEAISYAWGDATVKHYALCAGKRLGLAQNIWDGLIHIRQQDQSRYIWVDAICIQQTDNEEVCHQVSNMWRIYENAQRVLVWMGLDEDGDTAPAAPAFAYLLEVAELCCQHNNIAIENLAEYDYLRELLPREPFPLFSPISSSVRSHFVWLSNRPWASRLWVFQEVNLNKTINVQCGKWLISWDALALGTVYASEFLLKESGLHFLNRIITMRNRRILRRYTPQHFLHMARVYDSTKQLDRIYAVLGTPPFEDLRKTLVPDYSVSTRDLFLLVATKCILHQQSLLTLHYVQPGDIKPDRPSWVPDWTTRPMFNLLDYWKDFKADGSVHMDVRLETDSLHVRGVLVDEIKEQRELNATAWYGAQSWVTEARPLLNMWKALEAECHGYPGASTVAEALSMVLVAGVLWKTGATSISFDQQEIVQAGNAFLDQLQKQFDPEAAPEMNIAADGAASKLASNYRNTARAKAQNRVIFTTERGFLGIGSREVNIRDVVCVLYGSTTPVILRRTGDHYRLVSGDSYVHGIM